MSILSQHGFDISALFQRLLPAQPCLLCAAASRTGVFCAACVDALPRLPSPCCPVCALPTPDGRVCGRCLRHPPAFDHTHAALRYDFPVDKLIQALKFGERLLLADALADLFCAQMNGLRADLLMPVPLHPSRLQERGFNQSLLLAQRISRTLGLPLSLDCLRVRNTPPQSTLSWRERDRNMRGAFACADKTNLKGKHIAIVDDVMTTGASMNEMARTLKRAGAAEVSAWVIARTLPPP